MLISLCDRLTCRPGQGVAADWRHWPQAIVVFKFSDSFQIIPTTGQELQPPGSVVLEVICTPLTSLLLCHLPVQHNPLMFTCAVLLHSILLLQFMIKTLIFYFQRMNLQTYRCYFFGLVLQIALWVWGDVIAHRTNKKMSNYSGIEWIYWGFSTQNPLGPNCSNCSSLVEIWKICVWNQICLKFAGGILLELLHF